MTTEHDPRTRIVLSWLREDAHENAGAHAPARPRRGGRDATAPVLVAGVEVQPNEYLREADRCRRGGAGGGGRRLPVPAAQRRSRRRADDRAIAEPVPARPWQLHRTWNSRGARCDRKRRRRRGNDVLVRVHDGRATVDLECARTTAEGLIEIGGLVTDSTIDPNAQDWHEGFPEGRGVVVIFEPGSPVSGDLVGYSPRTETGGELRGAIRKPRLGG